MIPNNNSFIFNPLSKIDHVHLRVSDLQKSTDFYQSILGFRVLKNESSLKTAVLSTTDSDNKFTTPLLALTELQKKDGVSHYSKIKKEAGLYHFAILLPERKFLASFLRHIQNNLDSQYYEGMADHSVSESIYIHDPDFNGIEVYRDRLPSEWIWNGNKIHMVTDPLDVKDLLSQAENEIWDRLPPNTSIGHVHLHVSNLIRTKRFYQDTLGLYHTASYPGAYFYAADNYHHHVATNTWIGTNILPASNNYDKPGLDHYAIILPYEEEIDRLKNRFIDSKVSIAEITNEPDKHYSSSFCVYDPDRIKIQFLCK